MAGKQGAIIGIIFLAVIGGVLAFSALRPTDLPPLQMGYQICNSPAENLRRFTPLTAYLAKELGREIKAVHLDTNEFLSPEHQAYDLYHLNSLVYINLKAVGAADVVAGELQGEGGTKTQGWIIVRKDSGITDLAGLKGKRMIFGPMLSPAGYLAQYYAMLKAGIDPEQDLVLYTFPWGAWKHEKVVYSVLYGAADAGAARYDDLTLMGRDLKIDPNDFTVLAKSPWVPWCTVAASPRLDPGTRMKLAKALVSLKPGTTAAVGGERLDVLKWAEVDGFVPVPETEYDSVREMARAVELPPYQEY
jgi:phosphonate transport system substrate-binding protein